MEGTQTVQQPAPAQQQQPAQQTQQQPAQQQQPVQPQDQQPVVDWKQITGVADEAQLRQMVERYSSLQNQVQGLHPLTVKMNELLSSGASSDKIRTYVNLQFADFDKMDHREAIFSKLRMENPEYKDTLLQRLFEKTYGKAPVKDPDAEDDSGYQEALEQYNTDLELGGMEAKKWLRSQIVSLDEETQKAKNEAAVRRAQAVDTARTFLPAIKAEYMIDLPFENGAKFDMSFVPPVTEEQKLQIANAYAENAAASGKPVTQEGLQEFYNIYVRNAYFDDILKSAVSTTIADVTEALTGKFSGKN